MAFNNDSGASRPMVSGNWTCAQCGAEITQLPFQPRDNSNVLCSDCHRTKRQDSGDRGRRSFGGGGFQRKMHQGNWKCSSCGSAITELPFQPRDESTLKCRDCFKKDRQ